MKLKKIHWGENPEFSGPRDWFRNTLIIQEILKRKKGGKVLDFGCGSGNLLIRLADHGFSGLGIDESELAVDYVKKNIKEKNLENKISVKQGTEKTLSKESDRYDVIVAGEVLEHLKNDYYAIKEFFKILRDGGICIITVPAHKSLWDKNDEYSGHYRRYEKKELEDIFIKAGFSIKISYYWGFPLTLIWHKFIFLPFISTKMENYSKNRTMHNLTERIFTIKFVNNLLSIPFKFDQLFNWSTLGGGFLLVAEK